MTRASLTKVFFLLCGVCAVHSGVPDAVLAGGVLLTVVFVGAYVVLRRRHAPWPALTFLWFVPLCGLLALRLDLDPPCSPPPGLLRFDPARPDYQNGIRARVRIDTILRPGLYLARLEPLWLERRDRPYFVARNRRACRDCARTRQPRAGAGTRPSFSERWRSRSAAYYQGKRANVRDTSGTAQGNGYRTGVRRHTYRARTFAGARRAYVRRKRVVPDWRVLPDASSAALGAASSVPVLLRVNDAELTGGCVLDARLFGRGVPQASAPRGIFAGGAPVVARLNLSRRYHILRTHCENSLDQPRDAIFAHLRQALRAAGYDHRQTGVALAFFWGRSGFLPRDIKEQAARTGVLHLYAASGLHLAVFYACLYVPLGRRFGRHTPAVLILPLLPCALYTALLGWPVSLLRSLVFLFLHALASVGHRRATPGDVLLNTAVVVLLLVPLEILSIGSLLSFAAVTGMLYFQRTLRDHVFGRSVGPARFFSEHAATTTAAGLFTVPLLLYFFERHAYAGLPANLLLVPLSSALLPVLFGGIALALLPLAWDAPLWSAALVPARYGLDAFVRLSEWCAALDARWLATLPPNWVPLGANALLVVCVLLLRHAYQRRSESGVPVRLRRRLRRAALVAVAVLGPAGPAALLLARL